MPPPDVATLGARLLEINLEINREAFAGGLYSVAYHALAAALHCARAAQDAGRLAVVAQRARDQVAWINQQAPAYEHSTPSAAVRGFPGIFALLARQADAAIILVERACEPGRSPQ
jgi:hypothetical protein